ncbi:phage capsid protein [Nonomuraea terrae]|uniref:Phage capsid protein n=1 Tax=Nonomuraea terrae TaxID=2530383 RepID=A0A4R4ZDY4_9ACTN|nr:major capsid protein [Nonomuraea terrae]TDD54582.1 phage capsid protein [Nonomuraea terrae]
MLINTDYITPAELTGYVRAGAADWARNQFSLARWLPNNPIDDLDFRFTRGGEGLIEAATFRAYDAESPIGSRPGAVRISGELPPISRKIRLGEYDRLKQRKLDDRIRGALMSDAERMVKSIMARMELARGDALVNGKVTISENGLMVEADFGRSGSMSVAPGTLWSDLATATPLTDLLAWRETYISTNGELPGAIVTSTRVLNYLLRNAEIRALAATAIGTPTLVAPGMLTQVFEAHGLPPVYAYDAQVKVNGSATRVVADDKLVLLPAPGDANSPESSDLGATLWGTTVEATSPKYAIEMGEEPGIVAGSYEDEDPIALWTKASAIGLPILANPDLAMVADVA